MDVKRAALASQLETDPRTSNTGVSSSQFETESPENTGLFEVTEVPSASSGGTDWLDVSFYGCWDSVQWPELREELERQKEHAAEVSKTGERGHGCLEDADGNIWLVEAYGTGGGCPARWVLRSQGVTVSIVDRREYLESRPTALVSIPSMPCMQVGEENEIARVRRALQGWGFIEAAPLGLSRVDMCVDLVGVDVGELCRLLFNECSITRVRDQTFHRNGRNLTGFTAGKGGCRIRVYDKELETRSQPDKRQVMIERRWGGECPDTATRVEFQLRREWLAKRWGVKTFEDWREKRAVILEYLVGEWFRLTAKQVDHENKHQSRATIAAVWVSVQNAFRFLVGQADNSFLRPIQRAPGNVQGLVQQARGCIVSALAKLGVEVGLGEAGVMAAVFDLMREELREIAETVEVKRVHFQTLDAMPPPVDLASVPF